MSWIIAVATLVIVGFLLDREIYFYEAAHLGPRVQAWLYDRWAKKYDEGKSASQLRDDEMLAQPLLDAVHTTCVPEPFILDFATGTGRLSYALLCRPDFKGHIIALDLSQGMLIQASSKLRQYLEASTMWRQDPTPFSSRVELLRHQSLPLPFPNSAFDVICALEVLELFPNMDEPLREFSRVLRPGGILLASRGTEESGRKAKVKGKEEFTSLLERNGFDNVQITKWWKLFDRVIAVRNGSSQPVAARKLSEVMRCPECNQARWQKEADVWKCQNCEKELPVTKERIILS